MVLVYMNCFKEPRKCPWEC